MEGHRPLDYATPTPKRERKATECEFWMIVCLPVLVVVLGVVYFSAVILFGRGPLP
jgi:hypothetical protein